MWGKPKGFYWADFDRFSLTSKFCHRDNLAWDYSLKSWGCHPVKLDDKQDKLKRWFRGKMHPLWHNNLIRQSATIQLIKVKYTKDWISLHMRRQVADDLFNFNNLYIKQTQNRKNILNGINIISFKERARNKHH